MSALLQKKTMNSLTLKNLKKKLRVIIKALKNHKREFRVYIEIGAQSV